MKNYFFSLKFKWVLLGYFLFYGFNVSAQTQQCFRIGAHVACGPDYSREHMFLNLFMQNSGGFSSNSSVPCDTNGYPLQIPYGSVTDISTFISRGEGVLKQDTLYVCRWDGDGDFVLATWPTSNTATIVTGTYSSTLSGGRFEFYVRYAVNGGDKQIILRMTRSSAANHVRNVRIYKKRYENLYEVQGQKYDPDFLRYTQPFWIFRFMGAFNTNNSPFKTWADRTTPTWNNQCNGQKGCGLAYEWACDLCNYTRKHMWFNVPHAADNDAIRKMAQLVYQHLSPDLDVYLEYSNETWNWAPPFRQQFDYVQNYPGGHAALSKNMFRIWREVFGKDSLRVKRVLASIGVSDVNHISMGRIQETGIENFDVWSVTYYWGMIKTSWCSVDQAISELYNSIRDVNGEWYKRMKNHSTMARQYGKEMFCYEGGWGSDPQDANNFSCLNVVQQLQIDPRVKDLTKEVFDTLKKFGIAGGNELSLLGGWKPNSVNNQVSFWGLFDDDSKDPMTYPKYAGVVESIEDCDHLIKTSDTIGSGLAIRLDGVNDYIEATPAYKPNDITDNYSFELWVRPEYLGTNQYIWALAKDLNAASNSLYIGADNRLHWVIRNNAGGTIATLNGSLVEINKWYHVLATKSGSVYKLYVNGSEKASATGNLSGDGSHNRLFFGANITAGNPSDYLRGRIDEIRLWNTAITNLTTLRNWMCRKLTFAHPHFSNLRTYYRFDLVDLSGKVKDQFGNNDAQLKNIMFSKYSNYEFSGAPLGDNSVQLYPMNWNNTSLTYYHPNGDKLTVTGLGKGNPEGVHIYYVGQKPTNATLPSTQYLKIGRYYYGVFVANGTAGINPSYTVIYSYPGNPDASAVAANNRLLRRSNNDDPEGWQNSGAMLNATAQLLTTRYNRESYMGEYIIGQRPGLGKNLPGPGYALSFNGSGNATLEFKRPDEEYTVSFWVYSNSVAKDDGDWLSFVGPGYQNFTQVYYWAGGRYTFTTDKYWDAASDNDLVLDQSGWNHICLVKKNDQVYMYLNGMQLPGLGPVTCGITAGGNKRDVNLTKIVLGQHYRGFNGMIDEFQLWDTALDETTIRQWMCRKITSKHPYEARHLLLYYTFDEGTGTELENTRGAGDMLLSPGVTFVPSGAPIGDTSVYTYIYPPSNTTAFTLSIAHPQGDYLQISKPVNNKCYGAHLYRVDGKAQFSTLPSEIKSVDTTRYFGVYIVPDGYTGTEIYSYNAKYFYQNNKNIAEEANIRLLDRVRNSDASWHYNSGAPDMVNKNFSYTYQTIASTNPPYWPPYISMPHEFMLGGITPGAIQVDTARPPQPGPISGPATVCSGASQIMYSVPRLPGYDISYVWTLPAGMAGYSDSNSIVVTVSPDASGPLGNIEVYAINRNGAGPKRILAVTAQLVPSLSVDITGLSEVCSGQTAVYSIPSVPGTLSYQWYVPDGSSIVSNNNTSITVLFGTLSGNVSVTGTYACGSSLINTRAVTVNQIPQAGLTVIGSRSCRGISSTGNVTIKNSQIGIEYQAYKNGGAAPVGSPAYGTGMDLTLSLPLTDLLPGDNLITIKAKSQGCAEVTLTQTATVTVDVAPSPSMPVIYSPVVCAGDTAIITFPNALSGMVVKPAIKSYWRVDEPAIKYFPATGIVLDDTKQIGLPPSIYHQQLCLNGINKGNNDITFTIENGSCPSVKLDTVVRINVPNNPRSINFNNYTWWFTFTGSPTYPWIPTPDPNQSIATATNRLDQRICNSDSIAFTITNAQAGVRYYARIRYNTNGQPSVIGPVVSNVVNCTTEGATVNLVVHPYTLPITPGGNYNDFDDVEIIAEGFGCKPVLNSYKYQVLAGPDTTRQVIGSTVCQGENGKITIRNSQNGITYRAYYTDPLNPVATVTGNGGDAVLNVPASLIPNLGTYEFLVTAGSSECLYIPFREKIKITVISTLDVSNPVKLAYDCDTTCKGLSDSIWVIGSQAGVSYRAYVNGTAVGSPVTGTGGNIAIEIPYSALAPYENSWVTVSVRATAGTCATDVPLTNTKQLYVNGNVDLTNELVLINRTADWREGGTFMICPPVTYPIAFPVRLDPASMPGNSYYPAFFRAGYTDVSLKKDTPLNITAVQPTQASSWTNLNFNNSVLPQRSVHYLQVFVKENGCPLHPAKATKHTNSYINTNSRRINVYPDFNPAQLVLPDTVCVGNVAKVQVKTQEGRMSPYGGDYQMVDTVSGTVVATASNRWGERIPDADDGWLQLPVSAPSYLHAGENKFRIQMQFGGCSTWFTLASRGTVYVNNPPDASLAVEGNSVCNGNGIVVVKNAQNKVIYQPVIGSSGVADGKTGTGADLSFTVDRTFLVPGVNEVGFTAKIKGCPAVTLTNKATVQVVSSPPPKPVIPSGPTQVCSGQSNVVYTVPLDPNAASYLWSLPSGATTSSTSNIAPVNFGNSGGNITVQAVNVCGAGPASDPLGVTLYPDAVGGTISGTSINCPGDSATLTLSGYTGAIVKWQKSTNPGIWTDIFVTTSTLNTGPVLANTTYRAEVQSGNCGSVYSSEYALTAGAVPVITNVTTVPASDCGVNNGSITITASGSGTLQYSIDSGTTWQGSNVFSNLQRGSYRVMVKYLTGTCGAVYENPVVVDGPQYPSFTGITISSISDCGHNDGSITIAANGPSGALEYSLNDGTWQGSPVFTGLTANTYKVSVRYVNGSCRRDSNVVLTAPNMPVISNVAVADVSNCGLADGSISVTVTGGSGSYQYSINNGQSWQASGVFSSLDSGMYYVSVRNADGTCRVDESTPRHISKPVPPVIASVVTTPNTNCKTPDGTIFITASGTGKPLQYSIDNKTTWVNSNLIGGLEAKNYYVSVRYFDGTCEVTDFTPYTVTATFVYPDSTATVTTASVVCRGGKGIVNIKPAAADLKYVVKDLNGNVVSDTVKGNGDSIQLVVYPSVFTSDGNYEFRVMAENDQQCSSVLTTPALFTASVSSANIEGDKVVECLNKGVMYYTTATNKRYKWMLNNTDKGTILSADTSASVLIGWNKAGTDSVILTVTDVLTGCEAKSSYPVVIDEQLPVLTCRDTTVEAEYDASSRSFIYTVENFFFDPQVIKGCNFSRLYNEMNGDSTLRGSVFYGTYLDKNKSYPVVWHAVTVSGTEQTCVSHVMIEINGEIEIPSAFSPNNDGVNDRWRIKKIELYDKAVVKVFNRWGELVYDSEKYGQYTGHEWDGYDMTGTKLPVDSYHYVIDLGNGKKPIKGSITLLR